MVIVADLLTRHVQPGCQPQLQQKKQRRWISGAITAGPQHSSSKLQAVKPQALKTKVVSLFSLRVLLHFPKPQESSERVPAGMGSFSYGDLFLAFWDLPRAGRCICLRSSDEQGQGATSAWEHSASSTPKPPSPLSVWQAQSLKPRVD